MNMADVFAPRAVTLYKRGAGQALDIYTVVLTAERTVVVEGRTGVLRNPHPGKGEAVTIESTHADALFRMDAQVRDVLVGETVRLVLAQESEIRRIQRRANVRLHAEVPVRLTSPENGLTAPLELTTDDLSAGGLRVIAPQPLQMGSGVRVSLVLGPTGLTFDCGATVVRARALADGRFDIGLRFDNMASAAEDRLARFLMDLLRRARSAQKKE